MTEFGKKLIGLICGSAMMAKRKRCTENPEKADAGLQGETRILKFMNIEHNIDRIKHLAREMDEENWQFRAFLKELKEEIWRT